MFSLIILVYLFIGLILFVSTLYLICELSLALSGWLDSRHGHLRLKDEEASYQTAQTSNSVISRVPPTMAKPRGPTPRYAPHPPRCACPIHVRNKSLTRRSMEQRHGHASLLDPHTSNTQTTSDLRDDLSRLFSSPDDAVSSPIVWPTDTPAQKQNMKALSTAHSTIILRHSSQFLLSPPLRQVENIRNTTIITVTPYGPEDSDKRKGWWNRGTGNAVDSRVVTLKRYSTPEKKYEGGYKKGVHRTAYRRNFLKTRSGSLSSSSSSSSSGASVSSSISSTATSSSTSVTTSLPAPSPAPAYCFSRTPTLSSFVFPTSTPTPPLASPVSSFTKIPVVSPPRSSGNSITRRPSLTPTSPPNTATTPHIRKAKIQSGSTQSQSRTPKDKENVPAAIPVTVSKGKGVSKAGVGRGVGRGAGRQHRRGRGQVLQLRVVNN